MVPGRPQIGPSVFGLSLTTALVLILFALLCPEPTHVPFAPHATHGNLGANSTTGDFLFVQAKEEAECHAKTGPKSADIAPDAIDLDGTTQETRGGGGDTSAAFPSAQTTSLLASDAMWDPRTDDKLTGAKAHDKLTGRRRQAARRRLSASPCKRARRRPASMAVQH